MAYIFGQFNHNRADKRNWIQNIDSNICSMAMITTTSGQDKEFKDIGLQLKENVFSINQTYYCHCKIKKTQESQKITLKLVNISNNDNLENNTEKNNYEQYIKTINIPEGEGQWVDVDFIFTPQSNEFNTLLFQLSRITSDYVNDIPRKVSVMFLEIGVVNNIEKIFPANDGRLLLKIGIQSRPGLRMVINREEIYMGRTGVYEIKDGEIRVNFISLISPSTNIEDTKLNEILEKIDFNDSSIQQLLLFKPYGNNSEAIVPIPSERTFDSFTLDYIYEEK